MAKRGRKKRSKGGRLSGIIYSYKYLYKEIFGDFEETKDNVFNLIVGKKQKKISIPRGKLRAFIRTLNDLLDYVDEKNNQKGKKLWVIKHIKDQEYDVRNVRFRRKNEYYAILEYINRNYPNVRLNEAVLTILAEKLGIPYYLMFDVYKSWALYKHKRIGSPKDKQYISDEQLNGMVHEYDKAVIHELFG